MNRGRSAPKDEPSDQPPVKRRSVGRGKDPKRGYIHFTVPMEEKLKFEAWMEASDFLTLQSALRWVMWYARAHLDPAQVRKMFEDRQ